MTIKNEFHKTLGLLGCGIRYTLSPRIHNFSARSLGLPHRYEVFDIPPEECEGFLERFWDGGGVGLNVTTPHKTRVAELIRHRGGAGGLTSVNTLVRGEDWWEGHSTDGAGFWQSLEHVRIPLRDFHRLVILGNGGAVASILRESCLLGHPWEEIAILRRNPDRDELLRAEVGAGAGRKLRFLPFVPEALEGDASMMIQATAAPQKGDDLSRFCQGLKEFTGVFVDLVYASPRFGVTPSAVLEYCLQKGLLAVDGLPMLIEQARLSQLHWWGQHAGISQISSDLMSDL